MSKRRRVDVICDDVKCAIVLFVLSTEHTVRKKVVDVQSPRLPCVSVNSRH